MDKFNVLVISGKGGAGKSMFAASLLTYIKDKAIIGIDSDVDAPDLHVWLGLDKYEVIKDIKTVRRVNVKKEYADEMPMGVKNCPHKALSFYNGRIIYKDYLCEGCGLCSILNPDIFEMRLVRNGEVRRYKSHFTFDVIEGHMLPGLTGSGKVVEEIFSTTKSFEYEIGIVDGPPGTGCPVNASIRNSNIILFIVEETKSGIEDFRKTLKVVDHFKKPYGLIVNKHGLNNEIYHKIEVEYGNKLIGYIDYDESIIECAVKRIPVYICNKKIIEVALKSAYDYIMEFYNGTNNS